jgi:hypothetical protein
MTSARGAVRCSLRRGGGHIPQPGGAATGVYIGIDLHKTQSFVTRMTAQGHILEQVNLLHTTKSKKRFRIGVRSCNPTFRGAWRACSFLPLPSPHTTLPHRLGSDGYVCNFAVD